MSANPAQLFARARRYPLGARVFSRLVTARAPYFASISPLFRELRAGHCEVLVRNHFDVLLGPDSDFIPVMLYEARSLNSAQRIELAALQSEYETLWTPVLAALYTSGALRAPVGLARLLMLGALNWSVQWFDPHKSATVDDLVDAALALFVDARATEAAPT